MSSAQQINSHHSCFREDQKSVKNLTEDEAIIKQFMKERDLPKWFRGLSQFQMDAADSLLNSIRDDSEQGTSHRVRDALIKLGIEPLVSSSKIKLAMRLSRGNDLAFLWFLMELYYRHACDECEHFTNSGYTVNEQLIMSVIAHLDTIPTLRELDKLLPKQPPQPKVEKIKKRRKVKLTYILPYFERQPRPVSYGKSLTLNEVDNVANLGEYDKYLDPNYVVPNECNRWYADYKLKQSQRIATRIVKDQVESVFEQEDAGTLVDVQQKPVFCEHHVTMEAIKESLANELKVVKKKACEKYFDFNGLLKDQSYKRIIDQLNREIEKAEESFKKSTNISTRKKKTVPVILTDKQKSNINEKPRVSSKSTASKQTVFDEHFNKYDFGHAAAPIVENKYFKANSCNKPYKFNYNKIFDLGTKDPVRAAIAVALNGGSSGDMSIDHNRAVRKCCKNMWTAEVEKYKAECVQKEQVSLPAELAEFKFDLPYYDPLDKQLMESMLSHAIQEMRKNNKFVLASLSDAHKTPILKEWIKKRYGMIYTREEKRQSFKLSKKVFHVLKRNTIRVRMPELYDLSRKRVVTYGCKEYLLRKTNHLKEKYRHNFTVTLLANTRIYWGAVRPYQCSKGPPRNEFFAYLPARENDVNMFRPWKVSEYIRAKEEWDRKQHIKRMELLY